MAMVLLAFGAGVGFIVLLAWGNYVLDGLVKKIKNARTARTDVKSFLRKFGWQSVDLEHTPACVPHVAEAPVEGLPEPVLMTRFDRKGHCAVVEGTPWEVAAYQLNELLKLETAPRYATKPPMPTIIKRRRMQQGLPKSL